MNEISIIKVQADIEKQHYSFEYNSNEFKKLLSVFCSPDVQLSLVFENGKKVAIRSFNFKKGTSVPPNKRAFIIEKNLDKELISGVISRTKNNNGQLAVYLILQS